ncbi:MAG TPA: TIGR02281 family clan AA aspartic protease [Thiohalobacter sp.]|nr:TIGR02281 family clan AA aspartic protease [Thiohalobacter sp.]
MPAVAMYNGGMNPPSPSPPRLGKGMIILAWVLALSLLTWLFNGYLERRHNPNQQVISRSGPDGGTEIVLRRNDYGHYVTSGEINGQPVRFMIDTGASDVAIPADIAARLGLERGRAVRYQTANGFATGYLTRLDQLAIGDLVVRDVRASINPTYRSEDILLGMSVLRRLEFTQRGDRLILRPLPR